MTDSPSPAQPGHSVEVLAREVAYQGHFAVHTVRFRHSLFAGGSSGPVTREVFLSDDSVGLLPYDPVRDAVLLIQQVRIGPMVHGDPAWLIEIIAGRMEPGESPEQVAVREAEEEAGFAATELERIGTVFLSPGCASERMHLFAARADLGTAGGTFGLADEHEDIEARVLALDEALAAAEDGRIVSAPAVLALLWLARHRDRLRTAWR
ncbi:NUDIX domain-containing protein [Zavarzinia sp. CC-PAN008]|uniref:NUDIX domain-containing protein n=1 Tax=Zavarzinia sp. CC-PAN008 TaxID=3243332 RepID=UPI003F747D04